MAAVALHRGGEDPQISSTQTRLALLEDLNQASVLLDRLMRASSIAQQDLRDLQVAFMVKGGITRVEADALFALECAPKIQKCPGWSPFLIESISTHIVWETRPTGVVNESQGEWLVHWADRAASANGLAVLEHVLSEAQRVPLWFGAVVTSRAKRNWQGAAAVLAASDRSAPCPSSPF